MIFSHFHTERAYRYKGTFHLFFALLALKVFYPWAFSRRSFQEDFFSFRESSRNPRNWTFPPRFQYTFIIYVHFWTTSHRWLLLLLCPLRVIICKLLNFIFIYPDEINLAIMTPDVSALSSAFLYTKKKNLSSEKFGSSSARLLFRRPNRKHILHEYFFAPNCQFMTDSNSLQAIFKVYTKKKNNYLNGLFSYLLRLFFSASTLAS